MIENMRSGSMGLRWRLVMARRVLGATVVVGGLVGTWGVLANTAFGTSGAATAPAVAQCNPPAFPTGAGEEVTCTVTVVNNFTPSSINSVVTAEACLAAAGVLPPAGCTTTVTKSKQLVTSVNQCNGIVNGGGSNVTCKVTVVNNVPVGTPTSGVTVNQCNGSGQGGGTQPTVVCVPKGSTTSATVTQCNGSGNGGGATKRVKCTVSGTETARPITINQCNGSSNGGGSTVTCTTDVTNNFVVTPPTTTTTPGGGTTTTTTPGGGTTTTTTPGGGTTTTVATPSTVPGTHTGEPWSGWPYWALSGFAGLVGLASVERAVRIRRRRRS